MFNLAMKFNSSTIVQLTTSAPILAMQGILANSEFLKNHKETDIHILAVKNADDLITQLNQSNKL
jgi:hypothetical protein